MITHSETISKLMTALHAVQSKVDGVGKDSVNPHFKNRYASLENVIEAIRQPWLDAGLVVMQAPGAYQDGALDITTMISHAASGEWLKSTMQIPLSKVDAQGAGSATTYASRYSLMALFSLPPVDDDAAVAVQRPQAVTRPEPAKEATKPVPAPPRGLKGPIVLQAELKRQNTPDAVTKWWSENKESIGALTDEQADDLRVEATDRKKELANLLRAG